MLRVKNKADVAEIYLSGDIVDDADGAAIRNWYEGDTTGYEFPEKLREQLKAIDEKTPLEIHINSCGGSVFAGMAMANFISSHKGKTTAIIDGVAASMASVIFFSADNCKMPSNSYLMLHKPMTYLEGNADELRKAADILDTLQEGIENTYLSKLQDNISLNDLKKMVNAETWMTGTDAAEKFKVEIMPPVKSLNAVGNVKKLKASGLKIPDAVKILDESTFNLFNDSAENKGNSEVKKSDELKLQITAKREEIEKFQNAGNIAQAAKVADELNLLIDELSIARAKDKHDLANFLDAKDRGEWTVIKPYNPSNDYNGRVIPAKATATPQYRDAMIKAIRQNFKGELSPVLKEGVDANGGFLLPLEMDATISQKLEEENVMRQICTVIQTESRHRIPLVLNRPQAKWVKELERIEFSDETFADVELDAYKLATSLKVSNELLQDSAYNLEQHFIEQFTQTIASTEEDSFINGNADSDTSNRPTGFLVTLSRESDTSTIQATAGGVSESLNFDDLFRLVYSLPRAYRKNAVWLMHDSTLQMIRRLKDTTQNYLWTPSTVEGEPDKLLGYGVFTSPFFPAAKNAGDIVLAFGDFSRYYIADRAARVFRPLRELYAQEDATAFLMIERVDGALIDKDAIKLLTLSRRAGG